MKKIKKGLYFLPLGGADEIGMNMYAYCCNGKWIVVDAGFGFLNDDYPGMDMCYASPEFLAEFSGDVAGLFITHGHEDHMGAIAQVWPSLQCPVYGTKFSLGLIKERLREYKMENIVPLVEVSPGDSIKVADFTVDFVSMVHSVPETCGLYIQTLYGNVFHATDWRFDDMKTQMLVTDNDKLKQIGNQGVDMFVCDSTNIMVESQSPSESEVRESLLNIIPEIEGGLLITCFASNLMRLETILLAAQKACRTPVLVGRSLITSMKLAQECGYFENLPQAYPVEKVQGITADKAIYICTGSQANYRSALTMIAKGESKYVKLCADDTIIFSSKIIPGNEEKIERMQEMMREQGVTVITDEDALVHTSGHCSKEEIGRMYELLQPKIVFPVHGDKRFIREHKRFALAHGIMEVCSAKNGDLFLLEEGKIKKIEEINSDVMGLDRGRSLSLNSDVVKKRRQIAYNCTLFISLVVSEDNKVCDLQITSEDILPEQDWEQLSEDVKTKMLPLIEKKLAECGMCAAAKDYIRSQIRRKIYNATNIKPVTVMHFYQEQGES